MSNHPEETCTICGNSNPVWSAENNLFNKVNGSPNGILCPTCFAKMAKEKGIDVFFSCSLNLPVRTTAETKDYLEEMYNRAQDMIEGDWVKEIMDNSNALDAGKDYYTAIIDAMRVVAKNIIPGHSVVTPVIDNILRDLQDLKKNHTVSQSTPTPPGIVDKLRAANPYNSYEESLPFENSNAKEGYNCCCDTLATLYDNELDRMGKLCMEKDGEIDGRDNEILKLSKGFNKIIDIVKRYRAYDGETSIGNHIENECKEILATLLSVEDKGEKKEESN
jgi:hypothetical protein